MTLQYIVPSETPKKNKICFHNSYVYLCTYNIPKQRHRRKIGLQVGGEKKAVRVTLVEAKKEVSNFPASVHICENMTQC